MTHLPIDHLPDNVLIKIFSFCPTMFLSKTASVVSSRWNELCRDPDAWANRTAICCYWDVYGGRNKICYDLKQLIKSVGVRHLDLSHCLHHDTTSLALAFDSDKTRIKTLVLPFHNALELSVFGVLSRFCPKLEYLEIRVVETADAVKTKDEIQPLEHLKKLRIIRLHRCSGLSDAFLYALLTTCKSIESFRIFYGPHLTAESICHFVNHGKSIKVLDLLELPLLSPLQVAGLQHMHWLKALYLTDFVLNSACIKNITLGCADLEIIHLNSIKFVEDEALLHIAENLQNLRELSVKGALITDLGLNHVAVHCRNISKIDVCCCKKITKQGIVSLVRQCKDTLRHLVLYATSVSQSDIVQLKKPNENWLVHFSSY